MRRFRIGLAAVVMLALLRMTIGWHFLYEGVWKLTNPSFSSEGFWRQARGPLAGYFHRLIPDYDGVGRLNAQPLSDEWDARREALLNDYQLSDEQATAAGKIYNRYDDQLTAYLTENKEDIIKYFAGLKELALARGELQVVAAEGTAAKPAADAAVATAPNAEEEPVGPVKQLLAPPLAARQVPYQLQRLQDKENTLRAQARPWLDYVDNLDAEYRRELTGVLEKDQLARRPFKEKRTLLERIDLGTAYGLAAVGICLLVGLFTRLANVAGALFLALVVLAQPAFPGVFPTPHPSAGHSLFVNKEFVEMMAMLALACTPVGRWGGLDFFVHYLIVRPIFGRRKNDAPDA